MKGISVDECFAAFAFLAAAFVFTPILIDVVATILLSL